MTRLIPIVLVAATGCRLFQPEKYEALDRCAAHLSIYHANERPPHRYRILKIVDGLDDSELASKACAEGADAVVDVTYSDSYETRGSSTIIGDVAFGRARTRRGDAMLRGSAVIFTGRAPETKASGDYDQDGCFQGDCK